MLGDDANPSIIQQVLENMKGVLKVSIMKDKETLEKEETDSKEWLDDFKKLVNNIDRSATDIDDERTHYILRGTDLLNELEKKENE